MPDPGVIDSLCIQLCRYADRVERQTACPDFLSHRLVVNMATVVAETRDQLKQLIALKNKARLDEKRVAAIVALQDRYAGLEGTLKEIRNDMLRRGSAPDRKASLPDTGA